MSFRRRVRRSGWWWKTCTVSFVTWVTNRASATSGIDWSTAHRRWPRSARDEDLGSTGIAHLNRCLQTRTKPQNQFHADHASLIAQFDGDFDIRHIVGL